MQLKCIEEKNAIQQDLEDAAELYRGLSASAALKVLSSRFGMPVEDTLLNANIGVHNSGVLGAAQSAFAGASQFLACAYIEDNRHILGLTKEIEKPKQYYDSIYTDRESMFKHSSYALEEKLVKAVTKGDEAAAMATLREITAQGEKAVLAKNPPIPSLLSGGCIMWKLCGFSSQSYYITTFKRVMGTTPMEYRRQIMSE